MGDTKKLAHTQWNCKYHIVFAPKYRRQVFYGEKKRAIGEILRKLCEWKGVSIVEAECCPDHIHMLLEIPPKMSVSAFVGYLKGKSSLMIYEQFGELKFKYRNREFWCRGYYVDTVGKNKAKIAEYIRHQLAEDKLGEQLSIPYTGSPFYGPPITEMQMSDSISACQGAAGKKALQAYKRNHRLCRWGPICVQGGGGTLRHPAG